MVQTTVYGYSRALWGTRTKAQNDALHELTSLLANHVGLSTELKCLVHWNLKPRSGKATNRAWGMYWPVDYWAPGVDTARRYAPGYVPQRHIDAEAFVQDEAGMRTRVTWWDKWHGDAVICIHVGQCIVRTSEGMAYFHELLDHIKPLNDLRLLRLVGRLCTAVHELTHAADWHTGRVQFTGGTYWNRPQERSARAAEEAFVSRLKHDTKFRIEVLTLCCQAVANEALAEFFKKQLDSRSWE